jgi:hypothetical protein
MGDGVMVEGAIHDTLVIVQQAAKSASPAGQAVIALVSAMAAGIGSVVGMGTLYERRESTRRKNELALIEKEIPHISEKLFEHEPFLVQVKKAARHVWDDNFTALSAAVQLIDERQKKLETTVEKISENTAFVRGWIQGKDLK